MDDYYRNLDLTAEMMTRHQGGPPGLNGASFDGTITKIDDLINHLLAPDHGAEFEHFERMTRIEGITCQRNEFENYRHYGQDEHDEYLCFHYQNETENVGNVFDNN